MKQIASEQVSFLQDNDDSYNYMLGDNVLNETGLGLRSIADFIDEISFLRSLAVTYSSELEVTKNCFR